jgi:hypothetical protein
MEDFTATTAHVSLGSDTRDNLFGLFDDADLVIVDRGTNNAFLHPAHVVSATMTPGLALAGQPTPLEVTVVLDVPLEASERMILDFSPVGIPPELPLDYAGEGRYTLSTTVTPLRKGQYSLLVLAETAEGDRKALAAFTLDVYPEGDLIIYEDGPGEGWTVEDPHGKSDPMSTKFVRSGSFSHAFLLPRTPGNVQYVCDDPEGVHPFGYNLQFYINGGQASGQDPTIAGKKLSEWGVVPQSNTWTLVSIPISELPLDGRGRLTGIWISGYTKETFYIDDMRLVAEKVGPATAVEGVSEGTTVPSGYALSQNVPNPFNAETVIAFQVPVETHVSLTIYDLLGQEVRTLVDGVFRAGPGKAFWDGTDEKGGDAGSGMYFYRLKAGRFVETKRMVLLK